jgi:leucyl/phenylalanyl-tRNA--protein transferase
MIAPRTLLEAYSQGIFPMADEIGNLNWYEANPRAIVEIDDYRIPHDLKRILNRHAFEIHFDRGFEQVMRGCAERTQTWISEEIIRSYVTLHKMGYAHSVEAWQNDRLAGGLYGVCLGAAFFGESMFYRVSHASKVALAHLLQHLQTRRFLLHDAQVMTSTLALFGAKNISRSAYLQRLRAALNQRADF